MVEFKEFFFAVSLCAKNLGNPQPISKLKNIRMGSRNPLRRREEPSLAGASSSQILTRLFPDRQKPPPERVRVFCLRRREDLNLGSHSAAETRGTVACWRKLLPNPHSSSQQKRPHPKGWSHFLAETRGFEPPKDLTPYLISSEAHSTGLCDVSLNL